MSEPSKWIDCDGDIYPCVGVSFGNAKQHRNVHFDTGALLTVFDRKFLEASGVDFDDALEANLHEESTQQSFDVWLVEVMMTVRDGSASRSEKRTVIALDQWGDSPYARLCLAHECPNTSGNACGYRPGLLGRDLLQSHGSLKLDAVESRTWVV